VNFDYDKASRLMEEEDIDILLISSDENVTYVSNYIVPNLHNEYDSLPVYIILF